jgi:hypothetical protein
MSIQTIWVVLVTIIIGILIGDKLFVSSSAAPPLRPCTITIDPGIKIAGALHEQSNGKFCIPYADE